MSFGKVRVLMHGKVRGSGKVRALGLLGLTVFSHYNYFFPKLGIDGLISPWWVLVKLGF